ncbi:MAG: hypothetical protein OXH82_00485 [Candidatus Dadabacteria bacterium]|nr:hypothetical protein [Candidatus Dadabacteria bacterium]MDE0662393.1 hypothetical protein [Candidatus Dadabacteria bacterium]
MSGRLLRVYILALALGLFPLYGCGGGGGGRGGSSRPSAGDVLDSVVSEADKNNAGDEISEAAENEPSVGSVTQSSNANNGITTDRVSVEASYSGGQVRYIVRNSSAGWSVDSTTDTVLNRLGGNNWDGIELIKRLPGGYLYVDVYSEERTRERKDYIAGGVWIYVPDSTTGTDDLELGVFGDGSDPFTQGNLSGLDVSNPVTYEGDATAMYSEEGSIYFAEGKVTLTVDFDRGTVKGKIHSFLDEEGYPIEGTVTLEEADIGNSDSGFFRGDTDLAHSSPSIVGAEGKWGGQFFGNGNRIPRAVGGTFGVTTAGGEVAGLGVWGALSPRMPQGSEPATTSKCGTGNADGQSCTVRVAGQTVTLNPDGSCEQGSIRSGSGAISINGVNICEQAAESAGINWTPGRGFGDGGTGPPPDTSGRVPSHPSILSHRISPQELEPGGSGEVIVTYSRVPEATDYKVHINVGIADFPLTYRRDGPGCDVFPTADHVVETTSTTHIQRFEVPDAPGFRVYYRVAVQACNATGCSCPPQ